jgi:hypothetical protein
MRNGQMIGNHRELPHRHIENRTGIDRHHQPPSLDRGNPALPKIVQHRRASVAAMMQQL